MIGQRVTKIMVSETMLLVHNSRVMPIKKNFIVKGHIIRITLCCMPYLFYVLLCLECHITQITLCYTLYYYRNCIESYYCDTLFNRPQNMNHFVTRSYYKDHMSKVISLHKSLSDKIILQGSHCVQGHDYFMTRPYYKDHITSKIIFYQTHCVIVLTIMCIKSYQ